MRYFKFTLGILFAALMASALVAEDYAIKFDRPMKVGDKYNVTGSATEDVSKKISSAGKIIRDRNSKGRAGSSLRFTVFVKRFGASGVKPTFYCFCKAIRG